MQSRNSGRQPQRKSVSPPPGKPTRQPVDYKTDKQLPVTIAHAKSVSRVLAGIRRRTMAIAFSRIASRGDKSRPRRAGSFMLHGLFKLKLRELQQTFFSVSLREAVSAAQRSDFPEWFKRQLVAGQASSPKFVEQADHQLLRVGRASQKGILLQGLVSFHQAQAGERKVTDQKLYEINNLLESVLKNEAGMREINLWYRTSVSKLSPEFRRLKPLLARCHELMEELEQHRQTPTNGKDPFQPADRQYPGSTATPSPDTDARSTDLKSALEREISAIMNLATNRRFSLLKSESDKGKFPQLRQIANLIVQLLQQYPQPGEMLTVEELATSIGDITNKLQQIEVPELEKVELSIDRFRKKLSNSENFLIRQIQSIVSYTDRLSAKLTTNPQEKLLRDRLLSDSRILHVRTAEELQSTKQQLDMLRRQLNEQRIQHQEERIYQSALHKEQIDELKKQLDELRSQVMHENERLDNLQTAAAEKEQEEEPRRKMLVTIWPKGSQGQSKLAIQRLHKSQQVQAPSLLHTDSKIYYAPIDPNGPLIPKEVVTVYSPSEAPIDNNAAKLAKELEQSRREIDRLKEVVSKYDESFKSYETSTSQYRELMGRLKEKLVEADRQQEERVMEELRKSEEEESPVSRITIEDLEAGKRIMELQNVLSEERERHHAAEDRLTMQISEMHSRISKQQQQNYQMQLRCQRLQNEFTRMAEQNREVSIVLSKRDSFGNNVFSKLYDPNQVAKGDSIFTFSQSGAQSLSPTGRFLRTKTYERKSDEGIPKFLDPFRQINMDVESVISLNDKRILVGEVEPQQSPSPPFHSEAGNIKQEQQGSVNSDPNFNEPGATTSEIKESGSGIVRHTLRKAQSQNYHEKQFCQDQIINPRVLQEGNIELAWCRAKVREYEATISQLRKQLDAKDSQIREVMKESSIRDLTHSGLHKQVVQRCDCCLACAQLAYDLESKIRELQLGCIKHSAIQEQLLGQVSLLTRRLQKEQELREKMMRKYQQKCLQLKKFSNLADTLCKQIPNLEELKVQLQEAAEQGQPATAPQAPEVVHPVILNLVRAEDIQLPQELTPDMRKVCNIIVAALVDMLNKYASKLNAKQHQRILERYLIAMDRNKFKEAVQQLTAFLEEAISKLPERSPTTDKSSEQKRLPERSVREIKQRFLEVVGWENLLPAIKNYLSTQNPSSLAQVKQILRLN